MDEIRPDIGLAFSGGGFRATLFHLGVLRALSEANLLRRVGHITSVSGGSVMAAHFVANWEEYCADNGSEPQDRFEDAVEPLLQFIESDVRNQILRRVPWHLAKRFFLWGLLSTVGHVPFSRFREFLFDCRDRGTSIDRLSLSLDKLFKHIHLADLKQGDRPRLAILATEVSHMRHVWFTGDGFAEPTESGASGRGVGKDLLTVGLCVAASSAFPAIFPPVCLPYETFLFDDPQDDRFITDAGVYDNLGISAFLGSPFLGAAVSRVIVSDATATRDWSAGTRLNIITNLLRSVDIVQQRGAELQRGLAELPKRDAHSGAAPPLAQTVNKFTLLDIAQEGIDCDPMAPEMVQRHSSYFRTDFDRFTPHEIRSLVHHGYCVAWHGLRETGLIPSDAESGFKNWADRWPRARPNITPERDVRQLIVARRSHTRFFSWHDPIGILNLLTVILLITSPFVIWKSAQLRAARTAKRQRLQSEAIIRQRFEQQAADRIIAYRDLSLPNLPFQSAFPPPPASVGSVSFDGLVIDSVERVWDFRHWLRVPEGQRTRVALEPANFQTLYDVRRQKQKNIIFPLKTSGLAIIPAVPGAVNFPNAAYTIGTSEDKYYPNEVWLDVDISNVPTNVNFPLVIRASYWNAFQKDVEDAAFKAYTDSDHATLVVLFPENRIPVKYNLWSRLGESTETIYPVPPSFVYENGIFIRFDAPRKDHTYGIAFTWGDKGGTTDQHWIKPQLDKNLLPQKNRQ